MARLNTYVHVGERLYGPGEDLPAEVVALISNPDVWDGEAPEGAGSAVPSQAVSPVLTATAAAIQAEPPDDAGLQAESGQVPAKGGPGSSKEAWAAYAASKDVEVATDASREDIIKALAEAGVPTE